MKERAWQKLEKQEAFVACVCAEKLERQKHEQVSHTSLEHTREELLGTTRNRAGLSKKRREPWEF